MHIHAGFAMSKANSAKVPRPQNSPELSAISPSNSAPRKKLRPGPRPRRQGLVDAHGRQRLARLPGRQAFAIRKGAAQRRADSAVPGLAPQQPEGLSQNRMGLAGGRPEAARAAMTPGLASLDPGHPACSARLARRGGRRCRLGRPPPRDVTVAGGSVPGGRDDHGPQSVGVAGEQEHRH